MEYLKNRYVQLVAVFVIGGFLGYTFYPTKTVEERVREEERSFSEERRKQDKEEIKKLNLEIVSNSKEFLERHEESSRKLESLTTENHSLKQKVKKRKFKLIKPDGTIIEKEYEESDTEQTSSIVKSVREEFDRKVSSIENRWKKVHKKKVEELKEKHKEELSKVEVKERIIYKEKIVKVNEKKFRPEVGITNDKKLYFHGTYPLWGPIFMGGGVSGGGTTDNPEFGEGRVGIGIQF